MNRQEVETAVSTGLELLSNKSEVVIPIRLNDGVFYLKRLLRLIAAGEMALLPAVQSEPDEKPEEGSNV